MSSCITEELLPVDSKHPRPSNIYRIVAFGAIKLKFDVRIGWPEILIPNKYQLFAKPIWKWVTPWLHRLVRGYTCEEINRITQGCHIAQPLTPGITLFKFITCMSFLSAFQVKFVDLFFQPLTSIFTPQKLPFYSLFPCIQNFMAHMHQSSAGFGTNFWWTFFVVVFTLSADCLGILPGTSCQKNVAKHWEPAFSPAPHKSPD